MQYHIGDINCSLHKDIRDNTALRESFFALARQTFCLDFEPWYADGAWTQAYQPYVLARDNEVLSNLSVNRMFLNANGKTQLFIQIGTVMTKKELRGRGLGSILMRQALRDWVGKCDGIFLYANSDAVDYYPRFGFVPSFETGYSMPVSVRGGKPLRRLNMDLEEDRRIARAFSGRSNPFSALDFVCNAGLRWFYLNGFLREDLYYAPDADALLVQRVNDGVLEVDEILGGEGQTLDAFLGKYALPGASRAVLGFTPKDSQGADAQRIENDEEVFYVHESGADPFGNNGCLPILGRA